MDWVCEGRSSRDCEAEAEVEASVRSRAGGAEHLGLRVDPPFPVMFPTALFKSPNCSPPKNFNQIIRVTVIGAVWWTIPRYESGAVIASIWIGQGFVTASGANKSDP